MRSRWDPLLAQGGGGYEENSLDDPAGRAIVHALDIDGDGFQDLVVLKNGELAVGYGHDQVTVRGWDFDKKEAITGKAESSSLESYDLDGDANEDLIVTSYRQGTVHVVWGQSLAPRRCGSRSSRSALGQSIAMQPPASDLAPASPKSSS